MLIRVVASRPHVVEFSPIATVFEVKQRIFELEAIPLADQVITFDGHLLEQNEATLASLGAADGCLLSVDMSLLGKLSSIFPAVESGELLPLYNFL